MKTLMHTNMNNEEIYKKIIDKLIHKPDQSQAFRDFLFLAIVDDFNIEQVIFNHEFAKALWGEEMYECTCIPSYGEGNCLGCVNVSSNPKGEYRSGQEIWEYHLMNMVLQKDRIKYLEQFI